MLNRSDLLLKFANFWPPFLFSGIKIEKKAQDFRHVVVRLKFRFYNANYVNTQFGGTMFMMTDPFYMIMLIRNLGREYLVWDKAATINYLKPGKTDLIAEFTLSDEELEHIRSEVREKGKTDWTKRVEIKNIHNEIVATVDRTINIKLKKHEHK